MKKSPTARAQSLYSLAKGLEAKKQDIAASISSQTGVSMEEAEKETELGIARLTDWAAYCDKIKGGSLVCVCFVLSCHTKKNTKHHFKWFLGGAYGL